MSDTNYQKMNTDIIGRLYQYQHFTGSAGDYIKAVWEMMIAFSFCHHTGTLSDL